MPSKWDSSNQFQRLADLLDAVKAIESHLKGVSRDEFLADHSKQDAVAYRLIVLSEASRYIADSIKKRHAEVAWDDYAALGVLYKHAYGKIDWNFVWSDATGEKFATLAAAIRSELPLDQI